MAAAETATVQPLKAGKLTVVFAKGRVFSDGFVTPGQLETVTVSHMPPRVRLKAAIESPPTTPQCGEFYFCEFAPFGPAPGTLPFRSSGKGRALLTFVMPSFYYLETDPLRPKQRMPVTFADQQRVHIDVEGIRTHKNVRKISFGFARVIVQLSS